MGTGRWKTITELALLLSVSNSMNCSGKKKKKLNFLLFKLFSQSLHHNYLHMFEIQDLSMKLILQLLDIEFYNFYLKCGKICR